MADIETDARLRDIDTKLTALMQPPPKTEAKTELVVNLLVIACATVLCAIHLITSQEWMIVVGIAAGIYTVGRTGVKIAANGRGNGD